MSHDQLIVLWFLLVAVLWIGFFFLEGFDFGVAMLYPVIGKDPTERRVMINSIGPVWDGNEVWLITAGGAMFAAFPGWYSTLFSGLYVPLLLVLLGLIIRGVSFEYRALGNEDWRDTFDWCAIIGSYLVPLVFGIGFANMWKGMTVAGEPPHMSGFWNLFTPFTLLGGLALIVLFMVHGAVFLCLKTSGTVHEKANGVVKVAGPIALTLLAGFVVIGNIVYPATQNPNLGAGASVAMWITGLVSVAALGYAILMHTQHGVQRRENLAFFGTGVSIATLFATIFIKMFGTLGFLPTEGTNFDMWIAASSPATLDLMSKAALVGVPVVLIYSIWTYRVFRRRISVANMPQDAGSAQATVNVTGD